MNKFTKGEWININGVISAKNDTQKVIANTYANSLGNDENRANAKLIAAAPDLLEALSKLFDKTQTLIDYTAEQGFIDWEDETIEGVINMENAKKMAIEALKKATE